MALQVTPADAARPDFALRDRVRHAWRARRALRQSGRRSQVERAPVDRKRGLLGRLGQRRMRMADARDVLTAGPKLHRQHGLGNRQRAGQTRRLDAKQVHQPRNTVLGGALNDEISRGLMGRLDLGAYAGIPRLKRAVLQIWPVLTDLGIKPFAPACVDHQVVGGLGQAACRANLTVPVLPREAAELRVVVERVSLDLVERLDVARAEIDAADRVRAGGDPPPGGAGDEMRRRRRVEIDGGTEGVVTIEDTAELQLQQRHVVPSFASGAEALGWLYVIERTTLRHDLLRRLAQAPALPDGGYDSGNSGRMGLDTGSGEPSAAS